ncbi:MAG: sulfatase-like hydrolase/transferase [Candidatus Glassbacteria bacterium]
MKLSRKLPAYSLAILSILVVILFSLFIRDRFASSGKKNVILITIDTLRADKLGVYGSDIKTPVIDSIASEGVLFDKAYAQAPVTLPSHASILTGTYPYVHSVRHNGKYRLSRGATTIAEVLKEQGYETAAFVGARVLGSKYGLSQGFDVYDDGLKGEQNMGTLIFPQRPAGEVTERALSWLEQVRQPFFVWVHFFDPHDPYDPPPPFNELYRNPYDGEVAYVDTQIGELLEGIKRRDLAGNTLVVITADHGESLGEHGELTHAMFLYSSTVKIPLIISLPAVVPCGIRLEYLVEHVDILPTILSILHIDTPPECQGRSLFPIDQHENRFENRYSYSETWAPRLQYGWSELKSLRTDDYLFVKAPKPELYDLRRDPRESVNIYGTTSEIASRFEASLDSIMKFAVDRELSEEMEMDASEREALEKLGYIFRSQTEGAIEKDPKDMIAVQKSFFKGWQSLRAGQFEDALSIFKGLSETDPQNPMLYYSEGLCYRGLEQNELALNSFRRAIELDPLEERSYYLLSETLAIMGDSEGAENALVEVTKIYPLDPDPWLKLAKARLRSRKLGQAEEAYRVLLELKDDDYTVYRDFGRLLIRLGKYEESTGILEKALELNPELPRVHSMLGAAYAQMGDLEKAKKSFEASLEVQPESKETWVDLSKVLRRLGETDEAKAAIKQALSIDPEFEPAKKALAGMRFEGGGK